ncbi:LysR family transcriptional regulator [Veronia pacifica]|uniref:HTH lysR-type domain-containing protein n=1 Tax=Veronia pacifica TaxID=1080227 RepID=A0A1C3EI54_9GAMM|nr:LysR family transcriptional regulator [Veronia pacifica]ODA32910.1 hypothetical protein A8L45_12295 [Veronia pacifica]
MSIPYPPLKTLKTFMVAAQSDSFSHAALQLNISQSAVSKQILQLETFLGCPLFERIGGGIEITNAGRRYLPWVIKAMETLQHATADVVQMAQEHVRLEISLPPSMASLWLIPRLNALSEAFPDLHLVLRSTSTGAAVNVLDCDIAIHCLPMSTNDEQLECLIEENLLLVAPQDHIDNCKNIDDIFAKNKALLHATRPQLWQQFWHRHSVTEAFAEVGTGFEHFFMALEAVKQGGGVALIPDFMAADSLQRGDITHIPGLNLVSGYGYFMFCPSYKRRTATVERLIFWFRSTLANHKQIDIL